MLFFPLPGEFSATTTGIRQEMGVYIYASRGSSKVCIFQTVIISGLSYSLLAVFLCAFVKACHPVRIQEIDSLHSKNSNINGWISWNICQAVGCSYVVCANGFLKVSWTKIAQQDCFWIGQNLSYKSLLLFKFIFKAILWAL